MLKVDRRDGYRFEKKILKLKDDVKLEFQQRMISNCRFRFSLLSLLVLSFYCRFWNKLMQLVEYTQDFQTGMIFLPTLPNFLSQFPLWHKPVHAAHERLAHKWAYQP